MPAILQEELLLTTELFLNNTELRPFEPNYHLSGEITGQPDSQSPQLTGNWQKRENSEHRDTEDDVKLQELMEEIKRYIRSIDISNL